VSTGLRLKRVEKRYMLAKTTKLPREKINISDMRRYKFVWSRHTKGIGKQSIKISVKMLMAPVEMKAVFRWIQVYKCSH
jgi:hypothetical protein